MESSVASARTIYFSWVCFVAKIIQEASGRAGRVLLGNHWNGLHKVEIMKHLGLVLLCSPFSTQRSPSKEALWKNLLNCSDKVRGTEDLLFPRVDKSVHEIGWEISDTSRASYDAS